MKKIWSSIWYYLQKQRKNIAPKIHQLLIAIDQTLNVFVGTVAGSLSYADETFSSRCWRWKKDGIRTWPCTCIDTLLFFDTCDGMKHCEWSYVNEQKRVQCPPELRQ